MSMFGDLLATQQRGVRAGGGGLGGRRPTPRTPEGGRPGSNRRRPAWEGGLALVEQGFFGDGSRNGITQYGAAQADFDQSTHSPPPRARIVLRSVAGVVGLDARVSEVSWLSHLSASSTSAWASGRPSFCPPRSTSMASPPSAPRPRRLRSF